MFSLSLSLPSPHIHLSSTDLEKAGDLGPECLLHSEGPRPVAQNSWEMDVSNTLLVWFWYRALENCSLPAIFQSLPPPQSENAQQIDLPGTGGGQGLVGGVGWGWVQQPRAIPLVVSYSGAFLTHLTDSLSIFWRWLTMALHQQSYLWFFNYKIF